jgi:allantoin racemase
MKIANVITPGAEYVHPLAADVSDGFEWDNYSLKINVAIAVDPLRLTLKELGYVEAALRAEADSCDAIFLNNVADYGIDLVRTGVAIPVVGAGEVAVQVAMDRVAAFSIVTVWPSSTEIFYNQMLERNSATSRCASIRYVLEEDEAAAYGGANGIRTVIENRADSVAGRVLRTCRDAVEQDGAEAVVIGCTCMSGLTGYLQAELDVPVICPLHEGYLAAEAAARQAAIIRRPSRRASADTLARVTAAVDAMAPFDSVSARADSAECGPVCAAVAI